RAIRSSFLLEHCLEYISRELWVLPKPANRISVPVTSKWNIDPDVMPGGMNDVAQLFVHTKKHLEFVVVPWSFQVSNGAKRFPYHQLIMSRDSNIGAVPDKPFEDIRVIPIDHAHIAICDCTGLEINALAQPVIGLQIFQCHDVLDRPSQVGLDHNSDIGM